MKQTEILTHPTHVNGWLPAVYMTCMSQNFRFFHVSNLSVRNIGIFPLMYPGFISPTHPPAVAHCFRRRFLSFRRLGHHTARYQGCTFYIHRLFSVLSLLPETGFLCMRLVTTTQILTLAGTGHFASFHGTRGGGERPPCRFVPD